MEEKEVNENKEIKISVKKKGKRKQKEKKHILKQKMLLIRRFINYQKKKAQMI